VSGTDEKEDQIPLDAADFVRDVEKLAQREFSEITSRQEALQTTFPSLLDIFYHPIFDFFQKNRVFQQPLPVRNSYGDLFIILRLLAGGESSRER
jgi:hypothetical protein